MESVLRCELCNKPFDKESTLKRHGYYCRSRRSDNTPRSRSCLHCVKGKARCDNRRPKCSRCIVKGFECHYPAHSRKGAGPKVQNNGDVQAEQPKLLKSSLEADTLSVEPRQEAGINGDVPFDSALAIPDLDFAASGGDILDWNASDIDFADFLNSQMDDGPGHYSSPKSPSQLHHSPPTTTPTIKVRNSRASSFSNFRAFEGLLSPESDLSISRTVPTPATTFSSKISMPLQPSYTVRYLTLRQNIKTGLPQRIVNMMLHTLRSYPLMMLRHNTLPPFIHPQLSSYPDVEDGRPNPLSNCVSLVHMISSGVRGSRKLFWKNVGLECERLCVEYPKLNRWELLAGMQAMLIYILIRLDEGETEYNNYDYVLIAAVARLADQITCSDTACTAGSEVGHYGLSISWRDWVFEESRRRLSVIYRIVGMLFYFEPSCRCDLPSSLILAPLPAKKQLWEADNEFVWKSESQREPGLQTAFGLATDGELVRLEEGKLHCSDTVLMHKSLDLNTASRSSANWEEWCAGMDGFGGLVMLAASLLG